MRIAIIGAGIAGLSAARRLADSNCQVEVFEKSRGNGGRMHTRRGPPADFDLGAQYFTARTPDFVAQVEQWRADGIVANWALAPSSIDPQGQIQHSPDQQPRFVGTPGMSSPAHWLAKGIRIHHQTRIEHVDREAGGWSLHGTEQSFSGFDALIVATPAPQAAALVADSARLSQQVSDTSMTPCWAVALGFAEASGLAIEAAFVDGHPVSWLARNNLKPGRPESAEVWVLHSAPDWTDKHLEETPEEIGKLMGRWFVETLKPGKEPQLLRIHRWRYARTQSRIDSRNCYDDELKLGICGDWCGGGRVEGAWLAGQEVAHHLLEE